MGRVHIAPGDSAGGSMEEALRLAGRSEPVLRFRDDLSCGPIEPDEPAVREAWWSTHYDLPVAAELQAFWHRVMTTEDRLVFWFGRHSARELALFHCLADRIGERPYDIIDVTGLQWPRTRPPGATGLTEPAASVSIVPTDRLTTLFDSERPITDRERDEAAHHWRKLKRENAPFRIVTPEGLASAPLDHFDPLLLQCAGHEWQRTARVIGEAMGRSIEPYYQVGDLMLLTRVVALIEAGKLVAEGDPWHMQASRVRLPD